MTGTLIFGYPGDRGLGDRLIAAVLRGEKTATSSLAVEYPTEASLPQVGEQLSLTDHEGRSHGTVETTKVAIIPLDEVGDDVAHAEGEGYADVSDWRRGHLAFWDEVADLIREETDRPDWQLQDNDGVVVHWFRLLEPKPAGAGS